VGKRDGDNGENNKMNEPKVAFVVWNTFQVVQFQKLTEAFPDSCFLLLDAPGILTQFNPKDIANHRPKFEILPKKRLLEVDGLYDVIFFQAPFAQIEKIKSSHLVSVQYGLAKERHNYGEWRSLASMNLMYGPYSAEFTSHYGPSYAVGNVKFSGWDFDQAKADRPRLEAELGLDPSKKTLLFMPTYGELGSFDHLVGPLGALRDRYNIIIKMHHNNEKKGKSWLEIAASHGHDKLMGGDADQLKLLSVADLVISDFSGAIFDALYAKVPILLYQARADEIVGVQKFSHDSLEFRRRSELGLVCENIQEFEGAISAAIQQSNDLVAAAAGIRRELFVDGRYVDTIGLIREKVLDLLAGRIPTLTTPQLFVRETCQALRTAEVNNSILRRKLARQGLMEKIRALFE
jgi:CDP-glycerol glycerophosphotransferase (TagB/SpsB family)